MLVLLVAVAGGAVLAAAARALRTDSAYPRFLKASKASDALVSPTGTGLGGYYRALAHLPGAAEVAPAIGLSIQPAGPNGCFSGGGGGFGPGRPGGGAPSPAASTA